MHTMCKIIRTKPGDSWSNDALTLSKLLAMFCEVGDSSSKKFSCNLCLEIFRLRLRWRDFSRLYQLVYKLLKCHERKIKKGDKFWKNNRVFVVKKYVTVYNVVTRDPFCGHHVYVHILKKKKKKK